MLKFSNLIGLFAVLALGTTSAAAQDAPPQVTATIFPLAAIAAAVMEGRGAPETVLDAGVSPHGAQLKPSRAQAVADADAVFAVGPALEGRLISSLENLRGAAEGVRVETLLTDPRMRFREYSGGGADPHIWLSAENAGVMATRIAETLARLDPSYADDYSRNARAFAVRAAALEDEWRVRMRTHQDVAFITHHDALGYFTDAMGIAPLGALTENPEVPAGARHAREIRAAIAEYIRDDHDHDHGHEEARGDGDGHGDEDGDDHGHAREETHAEDGGDDHGHGHEEVRGDGNEDGDDHGHAREEDHAESDGDDHGHEETHAEADDHEHTETTATDFAPVCFFAEPQLLLRTGVAESLNVRLSEADPLGAGIPLGPDAWFALYDSLARSMNDCFVSLAAR
ncbi:MAG: zinc ABC transporter substrate-binding protein [Alphaproteobacteria bacterium]|nr:zinc ABC transporter substrate-binding protein [Alphaproteobacteria bacterium]MDA7982975.1 zinc ABC transporter substrate-binding protein [Alphaproteobacteria bacterium]MDA7989454.1 zinc ABC transporter substrate-binding protein [Alphaproteobacteria bacterium]MDA8008977.1 zinc ABC transporter substrate-binding protein [Alphaproteobacteria bacterium]